MYEKSGKVLVQRNYPDKNKKVSLFKIRVYFRDKIFKTKKLYSSKTLIFLIIYTEIFELPLQHIL